MVKNMNGDIPSVPITTMAGVSSLVDLLPEMPLPTPLPQQQFLLGSKSLLFHPRVAEEANNLLNIREDDNLVPQLVQALNQASTISIDFKDEYKNVKLKNDSDTPDLVKAILSKDPNVFNCGVGNKPKWNLQDNPIILNHNSHSPYTNDIDVSVIEQNHVESNSDLLDHLLEMGKNSKVKLTLNNTMNDECKELAQKAYDRFLRESAIKDEYDEAVVQNDNENDADYNAGKEFSEDIKNKSLKRKRNSTEDIPFTPMKVQVRKIERKIAQSNEKLTIEELMETNTYQRFNKTMDKIFGDVDDLDEWNDADDNEVPAEGLIPKYHLQTICSEAAKLKTLGATFSIPTDRTVKLLTILERNIRDGSQVAGIYDPNDGEDERNLYIELVMERVMRAVEASLTCLYIMTSPNMHKQIYLEDVIDRIIVFTKFQLHNTIYPSFDPVYKVNSKKGDVVILNKRQRAHAKSVKEKSVLTLYAKLGDVLTLLAELLQIQKLTDNSVLHASSMGISAFFVENISDLQLSALKLVTTIFMKYEKHRQLLLDDVLSSITRLPSSKRSLRTYRLNNSENIQMLTALVLQLIQSMVVLPENLDKDLKQKDSCDDPDILIVTRFRSAGLTATNFLYVFLGRCSSKSEEIDYRPIFENFVQDLLTTVNKPEWPAAELMLSVLGKLLVNNFVNKSLEMSLRVASLDYLGVVAARLRKDTVTSQSNLSRIDLLIREIQLEENKDENGESKGKLKTIEKGDERTQFLQRILLDYLSIRGQSEPVLNHARHFYIAQWYQDGQRAEYNNNPVKKKIVKKKKKKHDSDEESSDENDDEEKQDEKPAIYKISEKKKKFLLSKLKPYDDNVSTVCKTLVDPGTAELIVRYLASDRPFSKSFIDYLKHILKVLAETSVNIRTKAMKCLTSIVEVDPEILGYKQMQLGVSHSFLDHSTSVREAAVDLVGKYVLSTTDLIDKYYDMLSMRILDTGVSVRKRVIKILKDVCIMYPDYPKVPEICVNIIRRMNDEDGIRKLVFDVFLTMWFTPVNSKNPDSQSILTRKVENITDVLIAANEKNNDWFEFLLTSLLKAKDDKEDSEKNKKEAEKVHKAAVSDVLTSCKQIVSTLVNFVANIGPNNTLRLAACMQLMHLFAKIQPDLIVEYASILQPYLTLKCQSPEEQCVISEVAQTLEIVVPLIKEASKPFISRLEEDAIKLMLQQEMIVVQSCVACLGSIINNVTKNYKLIRDCMNNYHGYLVKFKNCLGKENYSDIILANRPHFRRSLYIVGLLLRFFDFTSREVLGDLPESTRDDIFRTITFFLYHDEDSQHYTLKAIGNICLRSYDLMLQTELKSLYHKLLTDEEANLQLKVQVLSNIEQYLLEEERRMIKLDQEWNQRSKSENLKEMGDVTSGMASTVIQVFLKQILDSILHPNNIVRKNALRVIQLILAQGLVHPLQIVPYLIAMSTDKIVSQAADKQLQDMDKKYPGFVYSKAQNGIHLAYKLQKILQNTEVVRGFRAKDGEYPAALNASLYSLLRTKQQRRALILSILKQFDEQNKTSLSFMLYLADNLAYFPYQMQDEPLYIIHHIDIMISVTGTNLLQSFREALIPLHNSVVGMQENVFRQDDEDDDEDEQSLLERIPEDTKPLQECLTASQGCLLLLILKQHLKTIYGLKDAKITLYAPSASGKQYDKAITRKSNAKYTPNAILQKLSEGVSGKLDENGRKALIAEYLEFKTLIMNLDPDDEDDEGGADGAPNACVREIIARKMEAQQSLPNENNVESSPPKVPKITIIASKGEVRQHRTTTKSSRKSDRQKKHHHKRKRKHESDDDDSDPDFYV